MPDQEKTKRRSVLVDGTTLLRSTPSNLSDELIEAFILYDDILIDQSVYYSQTNSLALHKTLSSLSDLFTIAKLTETEERHIYLRIAAMIEKQLSDVERGFVRKATETVWKLDGPDVQTFDLLEAISESRSIYWNDFPEPTMTQSQLRRKLGDQYDYVTKNIQAAFGGDFENEIRLLAILRFLFYLYRQHELGVNLAFHTAKGAMYLPSKDFISGYSIIDLFDKRVRHKFLTKKSLWLNSHESKNVKLPMLRKYVLNQAAELGSVGKAIEQVRQSTEAVLFRKGMSELQFAYDTKDNETLDMVFSDLASTCASWAKRIGSSNEQRQLTITLALPFFEVGKEFQYKRIHFKKTISDKLLVFIHRLISNV